MSGDSLARAFTQEDVQNATDARYRRLLEFSPLAIAIHAGGRLMYVNPAAVALVGATSADALLGRSILEFVHRDYQPLVTQRAQQVQNEGRPTELVSERFIRLDGQEVDVEVISIPTIFESQPAVEVIIRDVTAQRRAEEALRREQEQLRLLVEASGVLLGSLDLERVLSEILDLAQRHIAADAYAVWRYQPSSRTWQTVASAHLSETYRDAAIRAMNHSQAMPERPLVVENLDREPLLAGHREMHRLQGTQALLVVPLRIHHATAGTLAFYFHQPHRFTESEVHVATALANLAGAAIGTTELYQEQARLRAEAEGAVTGRDEILALVSHDLKNPLTAIKGRTRLMQRQLKRTGQLNPEQVDEGLAQIDASVARMLEVLNDLVDAAQVHAGQTVELHRQRTDLVALVHQVAQDFQQVANRHSIRIEAYVAELIGDWDGSRLARVLENVLANAIKFSPGGGTITITIDHQVDRTGAWAIVSIRDRGIGIAQADLPHIFEPFRRGGNIPGHVEGAGLGLAGAQQIIHQHGGTIEVESEENQGSAFTIRLPLPPEDPAELTTVE